MNKQRRNRIAEALELISQARGILEEVKDEEQESYENLPESLQYGERGEQMQENVDSLEEFIGYLEETDSLEGKRGGGMSHKYYSPLRPLSLGTFPKPQGNEILHIENFKERQNVPEIARQAWGYIEYKEALTEIEAAAYELIPSNCISEMENLEARR